MQHHSLEQLIQRCQQEATQNRQQEAGYCFELFRRAFEQLDTAAWEAIQQQYRRLLLNWIHTSSQRTLSPEELEDIGQDAWLRFWRTLSRHTQPFSQRFPHIGATLNYLSQCAISAVLDHERKLQRQKQLHTLLTTEQERGEQTWDDEEETAEKTERIQMIREWITQEVKDPQEKLLLLLAYEHNLSPTAIASHYPTHFANAAEVYRVKERLLKRARRALAVSPPVTRKGD